MGAEYEVYRDEKLSSGTRLYLKNINADVTEVFYSAEISMNILSVGQSLKYDFEVGETKLTTFVSFDLGVEIAKAETENNFFGTQFKSDNKVIPYLGSSLGVRLEMPSYTPFVAAGCQYAKSDSLLESSRGITNSNVDFSSAFFTIGLGISL